MDTMTSSATVLLSASQMQAWQRYNDAGDPAPQTAAACLLSALREHTDRPAVVAGRRGLAYAELLTAATGLANRLSANDSHHSVLICVEPGWEQVVAVAGALLAGVPWRVADPAAPQSVRWGRLMPAAGSVVLTQSWLNDRLRWPDAATVIALDEPGPEGGADALASPEPSDIACLLGDRPTPVTQDALATTMLDLVRRLDIGPKDRLLVVCPLGDAMTLSSMLTMLFAGGTVVIPDDIDLRSPAAWVDLMRANAVSIWHSPPALAAMLAEHLHKRGDDRPEHLRLALLGGEPLQLSLVTWLRRVLGPTLRIVNLGPDVGGGLWTTCHEVGEPDPRRGHLPIGTPLAGTRAYVLSDAQTPCPAWVSGRLYVGARNVSATGEGAIVLEATGETLCRTDYIGRLLPAGVVELIGEDAARVAVSGHPLNVRDVEAALATHPAVLQAAVVPAADNSVAFVKSAPDAQASGAELLDHLRTKMSAFLLPARVELVGAFPLTPVGQIDRAALTAVAVPRGQPAPKPGTVTPAAVPDDLVRQACALAARILGVSDVEPEMNLLDVGATSVQLVRMAVQAEAEMGIRVDVEQLLRFPSVAVLVSFAEPPAEPPAADAEVSEDGLILDPVERLAFKDRRLGLRHDLTDEPGVVLSSGRADSATLALRVTRLALRKTYRRFAAEAVPVGALADLLSHLRRLDLADSLDAAANVSANKYAYPSAGCLYPVQTYVTVAEHRVEGVPGGAYYYHPERHRLITLDPGLRVEAKAHAWVNRDAFRESAFTLYLVANQDAIAPMYGVRARDYCFLEAGAMLQLLMSAAVDCGLGLCPVGEMDDAALRESFGLNDRSLLVHALLGGLPDAGASDAKATESGMLARLSLLSGIGIVEDGPA